MTRTRDQDRQLQRRRRWKLKVKTDDGRLEVEGEVERKVVDLASTDELVFRAVRDGQVCRGVVNY